MLLKEPSLFCTIQYSACLLLSFDTFAKPPPTFRQHFLFPAGLPVDILDQQGGLTFDPMQPLRWSLCSQSVFYRPSWTIEGKKAADAQVKRFKEFQCFWI